MMPEKAWETQPFISSNFKTDLINRSQSIVTRLAHIQRLFHQDGIRTGTIATALTYDSQGNLHTLTDPALRTTTYEYDEAGRVTVIHQPDTTDILLDYDLNGNMTVLTNPSSVDHGFGYNAVNLKNSYQTPLSGTYSYIYDKDRRLKQKTFPSGSRIINIYDDTQLRQVQTPEGNIDFTYSCASKVASITKTAESITYDYDGKLITSETLAGTLGRTLEYTYDNHFNLETMTYAGETASYTFDNDGMLTHAGDYTISRYNEDGVNETGLPYNVTDGTVDLDRSFNAYGETSSETSDVNNQAVFSWNVTERYNDGKIKTKTETIGGTTSTYQYGYDANGRLATVIKDSTLVEEYDFSIVPFGTCTYQMSSLRGITGRNLHYDDEDHLTTADGITIQHDLDGFLSVKTNGTDTTTYDYSSRGELLHVTLPDATLIEYVHDPLGRRIAKKVNGTITEKYLWKGLTTLLAVYDGSNNLIQRFEYADGRMPVAVIQGGITYYPAYDQVGSLRVVADASGNVVKRIEYDSFGNIIADSNPSFTIPFGFAGGLHDRDTDLVRFGYRDYDPDTGRWTAKDPIGFSGGDTDLYGYVLNDPVNLIDPYGLYSLNQFEHDAASLAAGFGDTLTSGFGLFDTSLTEMARGLTDANQAVNPCSSAYSAGKFGAWAWGVGFTGTVATSTLSNGIVVNGTRVIQVHKHSLSMNILKNAGYSRKAAGLLRNTPLWHANWGQRGHFIFRSLFGK